jgi:hypothetical protein
MPSIPKIREDFKLAKLNHDAPSGTAVLLVEDNRTITYTFTRSEPWELLNDHWVVLLIGRAREYTVDRCFTLNGLVDIEK